VLLTRALAALVFAPALLFVVWWGGGPLAVSVLVLTALALWEYQQMMLERGDLYDKTLGFVLAGGVACAALGWIPAAVAGLLLPAATILVLLAALSKPDPIERSVTRAALVTLGVLYTAGLFPFLYRLRQVDEIGLGLGLSAVFCTFGGDTGGYIAGRLFGKHKLYPKISPNKTVEGLIGGLMMAVGVAFFIPVLFPFPLPPVHLLALGLIAGAFGVVGDLVESMMKRSVGAKDSSRLIPGHGGVLDRFDAMMFVAGGMWIYVELVLL
jgi:phosphatidate cytidylyltransferase